MGNFSDAEMILKIAKKDYKDKEKFFRSKEKEINQILKDFDTAKLETWKNLKGFVNIFEEITNKPAYMQGEVAKEDVNISPDELNDLRIKASTSEDFLTAVARGGVTGAATAGIVAGGATMAAVVGTMGLTWVGVPGGLTVAASMAGTSIYVATGMKAATLLGPLVAIPAIAVGAISYFKAGERAVNDAIVVMHQSNEAQKKFGIAIDNIELIKQCAVEFTKEIKSLGEYYMDKLTQLKKISKNRKKDYNNFTEADIYVLESLILLVKFIKSYLEVPLIEEKTMDNSEETRDDEGQYNPSLVLEKIRESLFFRLTMSDKDSGENNIGTSDKMKELVVTEDNNVVYEDSVLRKKNYKIKIDYVLGVSGSAYFENCIFEANTDIQCAIQVHEGYAYFKNCTFVQKKKLDYKFVDSHYGMMIFENCKFVDLDFSKGDFYDEWSEKTMPRTFAGAVGEGTKGYIYVKNSDFINCKGVMFINQGRSKITLQGCNVINHQGTFAVANDTYCGDSSGIYIAACKFSGRKANKNSNIDGIFFMNDSELDCCDTIFEKNEGCIVRRAEYDDYSGHFSRVFKNCEVDGKRYESDLPEKAIYKNDYTQKVDFA